MAKWDTCLYCASAAVALPHVLCPPRPFGNSASCNTLLAFSTSYKIILSRLFYSKQNYFHLCFILVICSCGPKAFFKASIFLLVELCLFSPPGLCLALITRLTLHFIELHGKEGSHMCHKAPIVWSGASPFEVVEHLFFSLFFFFHRFFRRSIDSIQ